MNIDRLCGPGNPLFALTRCGLKTVGRLSPGIQLGWQAGFDSGRTLDYVYENRPRGITPLGRAIDRNYLNSIGWRGIRVRKMNLKNILRAAIENINQQGVQWSSWTSPRGRGVMCWRRCMNSGTSPPPCCCGTISRKTSKPPAAWPNELGLRNVDASQGDAFDRAALAAVIPKPTVAIVSGLFELYPANEPVLNSLRGVAEAMAPGGYLVYTNQPWHPQVEFIARVLTNREGKPWIMRRRTQAEMDELVRTAGFEKLRQESDQWGVFSVSLARRLKS